MSLTKKEKEISYFCRDGCPGGTFKLTVVGSSNKVDGVGLDLLEVEGEKNFISAIECE